MSDQFRPSEQVCLLNVNAQCDRIWVSQSDGLRPAHIQTPKQEAPILKEGGAADGVGRTSATPPLMSNAWYILTTNLFASIQRAGGWDL